jgi:hypothetical protein
MTHRFRSEPGFVFYFADALQRLLSAAQLFCLELKANPLLTVVSPLRKLVGVASAGKKVASQLFPRALLAE